MATLKTSHREHEITRDDAYWIREALLIYRNPANTPNGVNHHVDDPLVRKRFDELVSVFTFEAIEE